MSPEAVAAAVTGRFWRFEMADGHLHVPFLRLLPDGRVAGERHHAATAWRMVEGELAFIDAGGHAAMRFDPAPLGTPGPARLSGHNLWDGTRHVLAEIALDLPLAAEPAPPLVRVSLPAGRRSLLVLRADERSRHIEWLRDRPVELRDWDLCVSWYGAGEPPHDDLTDWLSVQRDLRKFQAAHQLFGSDSPLWGYDYIAFPDDDLETSVATIDRLFRVVREHRLDLAQPALWHDSFINYPQTRRREDWLVRHVNFVELMMPVFSQAALRACLPTFSANASGFGLDYAWAKLIDPAPTAIAVIDAAPVRHVRPTGAHYDLEAARWEGWALAHRFGTQDYLRMRELGGVRAEPDTLSGGADA